jgi:ribosomal protein S18 acetylase RimI-like enzyme
VNIRPATYGDLKSIVGAHIVAFRGFYLTELGQRFLFKYYALVLDMPKGILLVAESDGSIFGFVSGFLEPAAFYSELRRMRFRLLIAALPAILRKPRLAVRLVVNFRRTYRMSWQDFSKVAELSSIAVRPEARGKSVGRELVMAFARAARNNEARTLVLTTDAYHNDQVNGFYHKLGFSLQKTFEAQPGRWLNEYSLDLENI